MAVKSVVGEVSLCTQTPAALLGKEKAPQQPKKEKQPKQQKQAEKKETKPPPPDDDEEEKPKEKSKDVMAGFPSGSFDMDDFKRFYSNNETSLSVPYFWEKFDPEHYSIWYSEYKFPEELALTFMSANLIGGMFQRIEKLKKYAFASVCIFGEHHKSTISGVWVWKGHELAFPLSPDWQIDYESYDWKKLDPSSEEERKMVNDYFHHEGEFGGKTFNQGKIFK